MKKGVVDFIGITFLCTLILFALCSDSTKPSTHAVKQSDKPLQKDSAIIVRMQ